MTDLNQNNSLSSTATERSRIAKINRITQETTIKGKINLDGQGQYAIKLPIGFFKHMLETFTKYSLINLEIIAEGDLEVDQHHLIEDVGICLGQAVRSALGKKTGIQRTGFFGVPMDDAFSLVAIDFGGRSNLIFEGSFKRRYCGDFDSDLVVDFFEAFSQASQCNLVIQIKNGRNDHHKLESIFKAFGKAVKIACEFDPRLRDQVLSTKGVI